MAFPPEPEPKMARKTPRAPAVRWIHLEVARWRLALLWFSVCGVIVLLLIAQSVGGVFGGQLQRVWGWALPNFLPTLALMVSVFAAEALRPGEAAGIQVRRNFFVLAAGLSVFYLGLLLVAILVQPLLQIFNGGVGGMAVRIELLETSNIWLGPMQGLVVASLGVLFFLKEEPAPAERAAGASAAPARVPGLADPGAAS
jgi:hypothetical protein